MLRSVSFTVAPGEAYGLVGESGCGKSTTAYAALRYLPRNGVITGGRVTDRRKRRHSPDGRELQRLRGDPGVDGLPGPGSALNPTMKVGQQVAEAFRCCGLSGEAHERALDALDRVRIADPAR